MACSLVAFLSDCLTIRLELLDDSENRIVRPRQVYLGQGIRHYKSFEERSPAPFQTKEIYNSASSKRRNAQKVE